MEPSKRPPTARRWAGEWLFQLTTITVGVLIALSFDAALRWDADRALVAQARATIALEIARNRSELEEYLGSFEERLSKIDTVLQLVADLEAGVEPSIKEIDFTFGFPSLSDAGWETAERTGALALMEYPEVQELAEIYALHSLLADNVKAALLSVNQAVNAFTVSDDPFSMPPSARAMLLSHALEFRAHLMLDGQLGEQLLKGYREYESAAPK